MKQLSMFTFACHSFQYISIFQHPATEITNEGVRSDRSFNLCRIIVRFLTHSPFYNFSYLVSVQSLNYPVFKKYGYLVDGVYHPMTKKGVVTRRRHNCLVRNLFGSRNKKLFNFKWRRGTPRLDTIKEEPEQEEQQDIQKEAKKPKMGGWAIACVQTTPWFRVFHQSLCFLHTICKLYQKWESWCSRVLSRCEWVLFDR